MPKNFLTKQSISKAADVAIKALRDKLTSSKARAEFTRATRAYFVRETDFAIGGIGLNGRTKVGEAFNPQKVGGKELVGKLGIGTGGGPDTSKIKNGWLPLTVQNGVGKVSVKFGKNLSNFGKYKYSLDIEAFYKHPINNYKSFKKNSGKDIQWMKNFIEGMVVEDHEFVEPGDEGYRAQSSRTKLGHMIKAPTNVFSIQPQPNPYQKIEEAIIRRFNSRKFISGLRDEMAEIIRTL